MPILGNPRLTRTLPLALFERLQELLKQMQSTLGEGAVLLGEDILSHEAKAPSYQTQRFTVLVSEQFSALLAGEPLEAEPLVGYAAESILYQVELTFEPEAIATFLSQLFQHSSEGRDRSAVPNWLHQAQTRLQPNDPTIQSEFTLSLIEILGSGEATPYPPFPLYSSMAVCKPVVEQALRQQVEQERLLNQVTTQIRQSLELPVILKTAVEQVRNYLKVDRLLIYQFDFVDFNCAAAVTQQDTPEAGLQTESPAFQQRAGEAEKASRAGEHRNSYEESNLQFQSRLEQQTFCPPPPLPSSSELQFPSPLHPAWVGGCVTYEARASQAISSVLNLIEEKDCYIHVPNCREKYRQGQTFAVDDVEIAYAASPCLLELLQRTQVRAKLVAPIVVQDKLWGLLIAQQCSEPRQWQDSEKTFLKQIAEHLAVAIYQARLYAQLQQQKTTLEQRVIERTQELRDTLQAAQAANRAKGEFLAMMSHELRTPLTCIIGMSATLLRWSFGQEGSQRVPLHKQRRYLKTIQESGEHLLELINDILDLSQVEAGKAVLNVTEFSLTKLVHQTLRTFQEKAYLHQLTLELDLRVKAQGVGGVHPLALTLAKRGEAEESIATGDSDRQQASADMASAQAGQSPSHSPVQEERFCGDRRRLKQILFNLLGNAIKFTPAGGKVMLRVWREHNLAVFQVEDTGIGIAAEQLPLLFQKFQQLDTTYHRNYEGTGLGLALTKQLVELHGGRIEVESVVGEGSLFTVWLPDQPLASAASSKGTATQRKSSNAQGSIVLVEDNGESATLICEILTAAGFHVVWLIDGSTALKQIELLQPKVVIVDWQLRGMDGYEITQCLRNSPSTQHTKVLALTSFTLTEDQEDDLSAIVDNSLLKPIEPARLLHQVTALMAN
jgi:two-component system sensor histidine kinase/response regulator